MSVIGIKVPKNICGRMKMKESPVAVPGFFAIVAVIRPRPTELSEKIAINKKAKRIPPTSLTGLKPKGSARKKIIITCKMTIIILEIILLPMKSPDVIGVMLILLNNPSSRSTVNDCATVIIIKMQA